MMSMLTFRLPICCTLKRFRYSKGTVCNFSSSASQSANVEQQPSVKPYQDIPGPKGYPLLGTALDYAGENKYRMSNVMKQRFDKYGHIYKEKIFPGFPEQVIICGPADIETVFRADGEWPFRPEGGELFLKIREEADLEPGIPQLQGKEWHDQRIPISKFMMVPRKVAEYHEELNGVTQDLVRNVYHLRDPDSNVITGIPNLLFKWSFESVAFFVFGKRFGTLNIEEDIPPDCKAFIEESREFFQDVVDLAFALPLYKIYRTKEWKKAVYHQRALRDLAMTFIEERLSELKEEHKLLLEKESEEAPTKVDFLTYIYYSGKLSRGAIAGNVIDLLSAGVDTTAHTLGWALYCLATNPEAQEKLRSEVQQVVGSEKIVTPTHISEMNYLRNCIKETMRLYPLAGFNHRRLQQDITLSGYNVPTGTEVIMPVTITARMPELFHDPDSFMPERWSKENKDTLPSMFSSLPFGFGPRMCVGRRLAELEMHIALAHMMSHFRVEYHDKESMGYVQKLLVIPERDLNLVFRNVDTDINDVVYL